MIVVAVDRDFSCGLNLFDIKDIERNHDSRVISPFKVFN